jgi:amino acid permease
MITIASLHYILYSYLGVAAFADSSIGLYPGAILLVFMGLISAYSFSSIGRACQIHNAKTFSEAFGKIFDKSPQAGFYISSIITFKTFFACLAYSIIIGRL